MVPVLRPGVLVVLLGVILSDTPGPDGELDVSVAFAVVDALVFAWVVDMTALGPSVVVVVGGGGRGGGGSFEDIEL